MERLPSLENSMDYIVHRVTKSQTWLHNFHFSKIVYQMYQEFQQTMLLSASKDMLKRLQYWSELCHSMYQDTLKRSYTSLAGEVSVFIKTPLRKGIWGLVCRLSWTLTSAPSPTLLTLVFEYLFGCVRPSLQCWALECTGSVAVLRYVGS